MAHRPSSLRMSAPQDFALVEALLPGFSPHTRVVLGDMVETTLAPLSSKTLEIYRWYLGGKDDEATFGSFAGDLISKVDDSSGKLMFTRLWRQTESEQGGQKSQQAKKVRQSYHSMVRRPSSLRMSAPQDFALVEALLPGFSPHTRVVLGDMVETTLAPLSSKTLEIYRWYLGGKDEEATFGSLAGDLISKVDDSSGKLMFTRLWRQTESEQGGQKSQQAKKVRQSYHSMVRRPSSLRMSAPQDFALVEALLPGFSPHTRVVLGDMVETTLAPLSSKTLEIYRWYLGGKDDEATFGSFAGDLISKVDDSSGKLMFTRLWRQTESEQGGQKPASEKSKAKLPQHGTQAFLIEDVGTAGFCFGELASRIFSAHQDRGGRYGRDNLSPPLF